MRLMIVLAIKIVAVAIELNLAAACLYCNAQLVWIGYPEV
jgi:hypothetical protein